MMIFIHKNQEKMNEEKTTTQFVCSSIKSSETPKIYRTQGDVQVRLWLKNGCLKMLTLLILVKH